MEALLQAAHTLAAQLSESACCRAYTEAREEVERDEALKSKLAAFKARRLAYLAETEAGAAAPEEERAIGEMYWALMLDARARCFIEAEREAAELTAALCRAVAEGCPVEPAFPQL